jgi:hypothetical protein
MEDVGNRCTNILVVKPEKVIDWNSRRRWKYDIIINLIEV